jgi:hypothetical protein
MNHPGHASIRHMLHGLVLTAFALGGVGSVLAQDSPFDSISVASVDWRDFDCDKDADRPYVYVERMDDGQYTLTTVVPYCTIGQVYGLSGTETVDGVFIATYRCEAGAVGDSVAGLFVDMITGISKEVTGIRVKVARGNTEETSEQTAGHADSESPNFPAHDGFVTTVYAETHELASLVVAEGEEVGTYGTWDGDEVSVNLFPDENRRMIAFVRTTAPSTTTGDHTAKMEYKDASPGRTCTLR